MARGRRQSAGVGGVGRSLRSCLPNSASESALHHLGNDMNASAMTDGGSEAGWERPPAPRLLHAMAREWSALVRRFRDAAAAQGVAETLPRRWRDHHPDAPPRRPLFASRDLPIVESSAQTEMRPAADPVVLPRAPEPMSDAQIAQLMAAATARPMPVPVLAHPVSQELPGWARSPSPVATGDLMALTDRFERGARGCRSAEAVEADLAKALATLRKLAEPHRLIRSR